MNSALASSKPDWLERAPKADSKYRYYVGRASDALTEAAGFSMAVQDAYEAAIRENYGFSARVERQDFETTSEVSSTKRRIEASDRIQFKDFEQVDSYQEAAQAAQAVRLQVWVLFRYLNASIESEKARLAALGPQQHEVLFSEQGEASEAGKGILEVTTQPSGAEVFIDGTRWGVTPLRLYGRLAPGKHQLRLDHPTSVLVDELILSVPATTVRVSKLLKKAMGSIQIATEPSGALVTVRGKTLGRTPTESLDFPAGEKILLEISHPEAEKLTQEITITRDQERELDFKLVFKPEFAPEFASRQRGHTASRAEPSLLVFRKPAAADSSLHLLDKKGDDSNPSFWDRFETFDWNFGLSLGYHDKTVQSTMALQYLSMDLWLEKQFFGILGIRASASMDMAERGTRTDAGMDGGSAGLAGVGYLIHSRARSVYGFYERSAVHHRYKSGSYNKPDTHLHQFRNGVGVGYQGWSERGIVGWMFEGGLYRHTNAERRVGQKSYAGKIGVVFSF
ncbi:MAG: PEGA domain-containing protein [Methylotenera sp.]|nr:PEGA domain-containing protein [Oligoflexia bacterium]